MYNICYGKQSSSAFPVNAIQVKRGKRECPMMRIEHERFCLAVWSNKNQSLMRCADKTLSETRLSEKGHDQPIC